MTLKLYSLLDWNHSSFSALKRGERHKLVLHDNIKPSIASLYYWFKQPSESFFFYYKVYWSLVSSRYSFASQSGRGNHKAWHHQHDNKAIYQYKVHIITKISPCSFHYAEIHWPNKKKISQNLCCHRVKIYKILEGYGIPYFALECENLP